MVKELRDMTGISVMECKKALVEADGDKAKALMILSKKSGSMAAKKADRTLGAGIVSSYIHSNKEVGAMVVLRCETDFVSKNEEFVALAREIALHVTALSPAFIRRDEITPEKMEEIKALFIKELEGKPENLKEDILAGKIDAYLKSFVLMEQVYVKDSEKTIQMLIDGAVQKFGERVEIERFIRFSAK